MLLLLNYYDSNSYRSFSLLEAIAKKRIRPKTIAVAIVERAITIWGAMEKRSHEPTHKIDTKINQKATIFAIAKLED